MPANEHKAVTFFTRFCINKRGYLSRDEALTQFECLVDPEHVSEIMAAIPAEYHAEICSHVLLQLVKIDDPARLNVTSNGPIALDAPWILRLRAALGALRGYFESRERPTG